jgi:hypothetical protein
MFFKKAIPAIFVHIPKTAGSTLHDILYRQYSKKRMYSCWKVDDIDQIDRLTESEKEKIVVIKGHIRLAIAKKIPQKLLFFTMLREPVARTISHYYYIKRFEKHYFYKEMKEKNYSLKELLEGGFINNMDNCQVRFLSDEHDVAFGEINETHYKKAIENLDNLMYIFGLVEYYDESILLFQDAFQWKTPFYASRNITSAKEKSQDHPIELLERYNKYDLMLYKYAKEKFLNEIDKKGKEFSDRVNRFRKLNKWFAKAAIIRRKLFD